MKALIFLCLKKILARLKRKTNGFVYPVYISDKDLENCMDLLMISDENKSHYVYIKDFNRFMRNKTKCKNKKHFCRYCLQRFSNKHVVDEHKGVCLKINGKQAQKSKGGFIEFNIYSRQIPALFMITSDFEYI